MPLTREMLEKGFIYREAIASVALSHAQDCGCIVCCAAQGNEEAFIRVVGTLESHGKAKLPEWKDVADEEGGSGGEPGSGGLSL